MKRNREIAFLRGFLTLSVLLMVSGLPAHAQDLDQQLADIRSEVETVLTNAGSPQEVTDRCVKTLENAPATGLDQEILMTNLLNDLEPVIDDDLVLDDCLGQVNELVGQYVELLREAGLI